MFLLLGIVANRHMYQCIEEHTSSKCCLYRSSNHHQTGNQTILADLCKLVHTRVPNFYSDIQSFTLIIALTLLSIKKGEKKFSPFLDNYVGCVRTSNNVICNIPFSMLMILEISLRVVNSIAHE